MNEKALALLAVVALVGCDEAPRAPKRRVTSMTITQPHSAPVVVTGVDLDAWPAADGCLKVLDLGDGWRELARACGSVVVSETVEARQ